MVTLDPYGMVSLKLKHFKGYTVTTKAIGNLNDTSKSVNREPGLVRVVARAGAVYPPSYGDQIQELVLDILIVNSIGSKDQSQLWAHWQLDTQTVRCSPLGA